LTNKYQVKNVDYIVVGGGLAGVLCSQQLLNNDQKVLMITDPKTPSASFIAAGTWNPIAFRRYTLSWRAKDFLAEMKVQYKELEELLKVDIYQLHQAKKVVTPGEELDLWNKQAANEMQEFMVEHPEKSIFPKDHYLGEIKQTGRVILNVLIEKYHEYLEKKNSVKFEKFNHGELSKSNDGWTYENIQCKGVIFCEGTHTAKNPYFSWLPLKPAKGDLITIHAPDLKLDFILKKNIFILPLGEDIYQVGATYEWKDLSWEPSESGLNYLTEKLDLIIEVPYEVIDQKAGVRPTPYDRRIIMGEHPDEKGLFVLNGFGPKGVLLGPLAAKELTAHLVKKTPLNKEMDISRCFKKHYH